MLSSNRRFSGSVIVILAGIMVLSGCATRKYVRDQVGTLKPPIEQAQTAIKENAERIDAVDRRAQQGITAASQAASAADQKATQAGTAAQTANQAAQAADRKADTANQGVQQANNHINVVETRLNALSDNYTPSETQTILFKLNSSTLDDAAKGTLDRVAGTVSGQRTGYMVEIQGFTDSTGSENYNLGLSQRRAETTQRYLVSKNIPLFRISIVGLGKDNPVADNKTRAGRDQNRRVEVRVLKSTNPTAPATN
jgi:OmpA-OmpF porin, OOP family